MLRPRKMKFIEIAVFKNDMDAVLEYLGRKSVIQFSEKDGVIDSPGITRIRKIITSLNDVCEFAGIDLHEEADENITLPKQGSEETAEIFCREIEKLKERQKKAEHEKSRVMEAISEANAFSLMKAPFSDFEHLSFLTLRFGRLDPAGVSGLRESLGDRAVIIPLNSDNRILAASSKKGRFALDSQLKKAAFEPVKIPENHKGIPEQMMASLNGQCERLDEELARINNEKTKIKNDHSVELNALVSSWKIALMIEEIKARFTATENLYHFSGWMPADMLKGIAGDLFKLTGGRVAIRSFSPNEIDSVKNGREKVPVAMKHNAFVKGFESVVFSYGAPLYGTVDPTVIVAFFFTLMFGIMFGDAGQGFVLLLAGVILQLTQQSSRRGIKNKLSGFKKFSVPLISVGAASMIMGFLAGSVFTNERLLTAPTRAITGAVTGQPVDRILHILPMAGEGGSVTKLFYFFGFTIAIGVIINSLGLIINIFNRLTLKKYEAAFFSKTGLSGLLFFWYALFIAVRIILGGKFHVFDFAGLLIPILFIFFGSAVWRIIMKEKPVLENGLAAFIMEGFVGVMETVSSYFSNTVSFLRVGAFALAHAVFSFIVFYFTDELARSGFAGTLSAALIMITGNVIIIALEGLIVAIQVIRLQYYEFFNKFFIETGVEFAPFSFKYKE